MIVLVAYATVEGHTAQIAQRIGEIAGRAGHEVIVANLEQPGFAVPGRFDAAILCGPIHYGKYPAVLRDFIGDWKSELEHIPTALVTVSLAITSDNAEEVEEARSWPHKLQEETGWIADREHHAAGALKYLGYDFFKRWMMRRISRSEGGPVDVTRDHVLTDWDALTEFVGDFLDFAEAGKA